MHLRSAERLRDLCCANRGTFIKVGQHLGALDYLLPEEYTSTLKVLHSQAPQSSMKEIQQVIREDLGKEVCNGFLYHISPPPNVPEAKVAPDEELNEAEVSLPSSRVIVLPRLPVYLSVNLR